MTLSRLLLAFLLLIGAEASARACSCMSPSDLGPRQWARNAVKGAVAIVEVDVIAGYGESWRASERVRVRRRLAGSVASEFEVFREHPPQGAACDLELFPGDRRLLILYPAHSQRPRLWGWWWPRYRIQSLCYEAFMRNGRYFAALMRAARRH